MTSTVPSAARRSPGNDVAGFAARLQPRIAAEAVITDPAAVEATHRLWNKEITHRPAAVVRCRTAAEVQATVRAARAAGLPLSVVGGGHDWAGGATRAGAVAIDLGGLRAVEIHPDARASVGGGATTSDVLDAARPHGLGAALGTVGSVGAVGLTLGGGLTPLVGVTGLGIDNLHAAEVVLADGTLVRADADTEPDLFWALRDGGGNFGVVTGVQLRLHPIPDVTAGVIAFPWTQARTVLRRLRDLTAVADDALDVMFGALHGPAGLVLFTAPMWAGGAEAAAAAVATVRALGDPVQDEVARVPLATTVHALDDLCPPGISYHLASRTLPGLDDAAVDAFLTAAEAMPPSSMLNVHHIHGAGTRPAVTDTAYAYRDEHLVVEILGCWRDGDGTAERRWVADAGALLDPHALPGGWTNLMGPDDPRARDAYGPNTARLLAVKKRYDPDGVFRATPLPA